MCAYSSASDVASICRGLIAGASNFGTSTSPDATSVGAWLSSGCAVIETKLTGWGYSVPPAATTAVYAWLSDLNTLYAAARAELSRVNITIGPGERTRGQLFNEMFWAQLEKLNEQDLTNAGLSTDSGAKIYVGGVSIDEKQVQEADTDRVIPRLSRGMFNFPDTLRPEGTTASSLED